MYHTGKELSVAHGIIPHYIASALVYLVYDCIQLHDDFLLRYGKIKNRGNSQSHKKFNLD